MWGKNKTNVHVWPVRFLKGFPSPYNKPVHEYNHLKKGTCPSDICLPREKHTEGEGACAKSFRFVLYLCPRRGRAAVSQHLVRGELILSRVRVGPRLPIAEAEPGALPLISPHTRRTFCVREARLRAGNRVRMMPEVVEAVVQKIISAIRLRECVCKQASK